MIFSAGLLRSLTRNNFSDTNEKIVICNKNGRSLPPRCRVSKPQAKAAQMRLSLPSWRPSRALLHKNPLESVIARLAQPLPEPCSFRRQPIGGALSLATSAGSSLAGDGSLSAETLILAFRLLASGSAPFSESSLVSFWLSSGLVFSTSSPFPESSFVSFWLSSGLAFSTILTASLSVISPRPTCAVRYLPAYCAVSQAQAGSSLHLCFTWKGCSACLLLGRPFIAWVLAGLVYRRG